MTALLRRPFLINAAGSERFKDATVLVAGATGGVGRRVVQRLAREGANVKALVRDFAKGVSSIVLECGGAPAVFRSRLCRALFCRALDQLVSLQAQPGFPKATGFYIAAQPAWPMSCTCETLACRM